LHLWCYLPSFTFSTRTRDPGKWLFKNLANLVSLVFLGAAAITFGLRRLPRTRTYFVLGTAAGLRRDRLFTAILKISFNYESSCRRPKLLAKSLPRLGLQFPKRSFRSRVLTMLVGLLGS
jgi:hypothetical protein